MINSKTALKRLYGEIGETIREKNGYGVGWGFGLAEYKSWMMKEGFRTDTPKCVANRWLKTWEMCDLIIQIKGCDRNGLSFDAFWFRSVDRAGSECVGAVANRENLNKIYDSRGDYSAKLRYPPEPPEEASS